MVKKLRVRATHFIQKLHRVKDSSVLLLQYMYVHGCLDLPSIQNCPDSVPYTLAVYNSKSLSSSSESKETLTKQVHIHPKCKHVHHGSILMMCIWMHISLVNVCTYNVAWQCEWL